MRNAEMTGEQLEELHEALGDRYLELMKRHRVTRPPVVGWATGEHETQAVILWDEPEEPELVLGPRGMLPDIVCSRVLVRLAGAGGRN